MMFERPRGEGSSQASGCPQPRIAVVGAGPAGLAVTIALMRRLRRPFEAWLVDPEGPGSVAGGADGTVPTAEPAGSLSVLPERPDDFALWLKATLLAGGTVAALCRPQALHVPRALFRDYLMARFTAALGARRDVRLRIVRDAVHHVEPAAGRPRLHLRDGESAVFDHVFLTDAEALAPADRGGLSVIGCSGDFSGTVRQAYRAALGVQPQAAPLRPRLPAGR